MLTDIDLAAQPLPEQPEGVIERLFRLWNTSEQLHLPLLAFSSLRPQSVGGGEQPSWAMN